MAVFSEERSDNKQLIVETNLGNAFYRISVFTGTSIQNNITAYIYWVCEEAFPITIEYAIEEIIKECKDINALKRVILTKINRIYENYVKQMTLEVPEGEIQTWTLQKIEAENYPKTNSAPLLEALAKSRGIKLQDLVNKVNEKNAIYVANIAKLTGIRQKLEDTIGATNDIEVLKKIEWPSQQQQEKEPPAKETK